VVLWFQLYPAASLLKRLAGHRTTHASLILMLLSQKSGAAATAPQRLLEPLRDSQRRVLRYLPTNLTGPEIADELYVSPHTIKTHMRTLYAKLGAHRRGEAVARARELGCSPRRLDRVAEITPS
jgi:LuxR family transcriptional regulator, maltose regulon positive regulatory protein